MCTSRAPVPNGSIRVWNNNCSFGFVPFEHWEHLSQRTRTNLAQSKKCEGYMEWTQRTWCQSLPADLLLLGWDTCWHRSIFWPLKKTWVGSKIYSRNYRCTYFRLFFNCSSKEKWCCYLGACLQAPACAGHLQRDGSPHSQLRDAHRLRDSWHEMQSLQTVSITLCHTLPITAHVKCTHRNRHWKAKTAPVSELTICYLSLHCCAAFTFPVVISQTEKTIFSNTCFVISFFLNI